MLNSTTSRGALSAMTPILAGLINVIPPRDGLNWYIYTENNPLKYIDPSGMILLTPTRGFRDRLF